MSKRFDIDREHSTFRAELKAKHERAEKLRNLLHKGKSLFQKQIDKNKDVAKPVSPFVQEQQVKYAQTGFSLSPTPTPANQQTANNKQAELEQYLNYRNFEKSMYRGR